MTVGWPGGGASPGKPSPSGRGLGEGESPYAAQPHITDDAARKSPPFAKGGLGGLYTYIYTYTYTYTPPETAANLLLW